MQVKEMAKGTRDRFHFAICGECNSAYILDFPPNIADYYQDYYSFHDDSLTLDQFWWKRTLVSVYAGCIIRPGLGFLFSSMFRCPSPREMRFLTPNLQAFLFLGAKSGARILDVGGGGGQFVKMLDRFGYRNVISIDPFLDPEAERPNLRRADILSMDGTYEVILFNHSLEHMTNPETALKRCADLLARDGTVIIHIPNMDSQKFTEYKENWCWMHAPYHFAIPSRKGLDLMAARC